MKIYNKSNYGCEYLIIIIKRCLAWQRFRNYYRKDKRASFVRIYFINRVKTKIRDEGCALLRNT